jgi:hypothetical protein
VPCGLAPNQPFNATVTIRNIGQGCLRGPFFIGGGLSLDCIPENGNDVSVGGEWKELNPPLHFGESRDVDVAFTAPPNPIVGLQHLIIAADTVGNLPCRTICEGREYNNLDCAPMPVAPTILAIDDIHLPPESPTPEYSASTCLRHHDPPTGHRQKHDLRLCKTTCESRADRKRECFLAGVRGSWAVMRSLGHGDRYVERSVGPSEADCGQLDQLHSYRFGHISVCARACNPYRALWVEDPYYDLRVEILNAPLPQRSAGAQAAFRPLGTFG